MGKADKSAKRSTIERDLVEYRIPEEIEDLRLVRISGISSNIWVFSYIIKASYDYQRENSLALSFSHKAKIRLCTQTGLKILL